MLRPSPMRTTSTPLARLSPSSLMLLATIATIASLTRVLAWLARLLCSNLIKRYSSSLQYKRQSLCFSETVFVAAVELYPCCLWFPNLFPFWELPVFTYAILCCQMVVLSIHMHWFWPCVITDHSVLHVPARELTDYYRCINVIYKNYKAYNIFHLNQPNDRQKLNFVQKVKTMPSDIRPFWSWATHSAIHMIFRISCSLQGQKEKMYVSEILKLTWYKMARNTQYTMIIAK